MSSSLFHSTQALHRGLKLPFLYQTRTLRRYYNALQDLAIENQAKATTTTSESKPPPPSSTPRSSHSRPVPVQEEFVPFENAEPQAPTVTLPILQAQSLTGSERNAFAQLESLATTTTTASRSSKRRRKTDTFTSLDQVLNEAIMALAKDTPTTVTNEPSDLSTTTTSIMSRKERRAAAAQQTPGPSPLLPSNPQAPAEQEADFAHALSTASDDLALWNLLEAEIFTPIAALNLDTAATAASLLPTTSTPLFFSHQHRSLMQDVPARLVSAASTLRRDFPSSNLILSILPRLHSLGPSAYALSATPNLYNQILAFQFAKYTDLDACNNLLTEMDQNVVEPNFTTLQVLDHILAFGQKAQTAMLGEPLRQIWETEKFKRSFGGLERWKGVLEERLQVMEVRAVNDGSRTRRSRGKSHDHVDVDDRVVYSPFSPFSPSSPSFSPSSSPSSSGHGNLVRYTR
jgi:hypothetical protein